MESAAKQEKKARQQLLRYGKNMKELATEWNSFESVFGYEKPEKKVVEEWAKILGCENEAHAVEQLIRSRPPAEKKKLMSLHKAIIQKLSSSTSRPQTGKSADSQRSRGSRKSSSRSHPSRSGSGKAQSSSGKTSSHASSTAIIIPPTSEVKGYLELNEQTAAAKATRDAQWRQMDAKLNPHRSRTRSAVRDSRKAIKNLVERYKKDSWRSTSADFGSYFEKPGGSGHGNPAHPKLADRNPDVFESLNSNQKRELRDVELTLRWVKTQREGLQTDYTANMRPSTVPHRKHPKLLPYAGASNCGLYPDLWWKDPDMAPPPHQWTTDDLKDVQHHFDNLHMNNMLKAKAAKSAPLAHSKGAAQAMQQYIDLGYTSDYMAGCGSKKRSPRVKAKDNARKSQQRGPTAPMWYDIACGYTVLPEVEPKDLYHNQKPPTI